MKTHTKVNMTGQHHSHRHAHGRHAQHMGGRGMGGFFAMGGHRGSGPDSFDWGDQEERGPGGRRGRGRMFDSGELRLVLLKLIAEGPRHGYDLIRAIDALTGGAYVPSPGIVYPTLTLLADMELIAETESAGARKLFAITAAGEAHLAERAEEVKLIIARLEGLGEMRDRSNRGPVRRAIGNLKAAMHGRLHSETVTDELPHDIAAILDEAARKIERL